jgi:prophage antirepressor-like protein
MQKQVQQMRAMVQGDLFGHDVRMETIGDEPWFLALDVCAAIGIQNHKMAMKSLKMDEKMKHVLYVSGQRRKVWFVSEPGLYCLIFQSRKSDAQKFKRRTILLLAGRAAVAAAPAMAAAPAT